MLVVLATVATVLLGGHSYIALGLVVTPAWPEPWSTVLLFAVIGLGLSMLAVPFAERFVPTRWRRALSWISSVWMGAAWLWLMGLLASDSVLLLTGMATTTELYRTRSIVFGVAFLGFAAIAVPRALRPPPVKKVDVTLARWPRALDGYRIVQISDIHIGPLLGRRFADSLTEAVNALEPDLIAVTGDLVDGPVRLLADEVAPMSELTARDGVYFVTGNHDHYSKADPWVTYLRGLGVKVLRNERVRVERDSGEFDVVGVEDHDAARVSAWREDLPSALDGRDSSVPAILLAHDPRTFPDAATHGVDLQLSGHTHGGQIFPFGFFVRLVIPFVAGLYRRGQSQLYVSRGTGFWGPPMRLGAPAEITELTLRAPNTPSR